MILPINFAFRDHCANGVHPGFASYLYPYTHYYNGFWQPPRLYEDQAYTSWVPLTYIDATATNDEAFFGALVNDNYTVGGAEVVLESSYLTWLYDHNQTMPAGDPTDWVFTYGDEDTRISGLYNWGFPAVITWFEVAWD